MKAVFRNLFVMLVLTIGTVVSASAQPTVKGKVTDLDGRPLEGVVVVVKGTTNGAMTDVNGNYFISSLKKGDVLVFSSLGLAEQSFVCNGSMTKLDVTMKEDVTFLEETIVVGYGVQKKSSMTSAVSAIKGSDLLKAPSTNVSQLLAGRLTGVSSVQESGEPGLDQAAIRIRGAQGGAKYVVDGFPVDNINDIDPYDIESISVLKDGASAAVYGLQAANGVIIITTKKGTSSAPKITYNATLGASMNANFPEFMDGPEFAYYYNVADMMDKLASGAIASEADYVPYFTKGNVEAMLNGDPTDGWDNVNYIDRIFGTGITQKHNLTVQGGSDKSRYFASFGYLGQEGNIDNFNYDRYNVRTNIESDLAENFRFTLGLSGVLSKRHTYNLHYTQGNLNNQIGVPLTLLQITRAHELAIVEMGASHPGDIKELVEIAEPNCGLITNVGRAHLEGFGSFEGVQRTKQELYDYLLKHYGAIFRNADNPYLLRMHQNAIDTNYRYKVKAERLNKLYVYTTGKLPSGTHLVGEYNAENVSAAICVGKCFGVSHEQALEAIRQYVPTNNRSQSMQTAHNHLVVDAYNANPTSMQAAINAFQGDTYILGAMRELGEYSHLEHQNLVNMLAERKADLVYLVGEEYRQTTSPYPIFDRVEELRAYLEQHPLRDRKILLKGSRSTKMETLLDIL